jgi:glucose/arabinose dehydrogenase
MRSRLNAVRFIAYEGLFMVLVLVAALLVSQPRASADDFTDPAFTTETVATFSPFSLVGMAFAPDGRIFVWQKNGVIRIIKNGSVLPTPFLDISNKVNTFDDRGFWGLAFDPNFTTNGFIYMSYVFENTGNTNDTGAKTSRFSRVTANPANPDVALAGSETVILGSVGTPPCSAQPPGSDCIPADGSSHTIGSIVFAPDGTLYLGNGDGSTRASPIRSRCAPRTSTATTGRSCTSTRTAPRCRATRSTTGPIPCGPRSGCTASATRSGSASTR